MFNLFKNPKEKLKEEMFNNIENMAFLNLRDSGLKNTPLEGTILISCIKDAEDFFIKRSIDISEKYGVSRETAISVIKEVAQKVCDEYISY